ncbi:hypothetical protein EDC96DRAFT_568127 [Choanephora cucurbitarum]|nr:hypothetical protein EDC96DRAFT_568127 [Choanephora cucurbitarum]
MQHNDNMNNGNKDLKYDTGLSQNPDTGYVNYDEVKQSDQTNTHESPKMSINPKQHAPIVTGRDDPEQIKESTVSDKQPNKEKKKPLNTGGDAHHIAEQPSQGLGGLTGDQPVGEVNFKRL